MGKRLGQGGGFSGRWVSLEGNYSEGILVGKRLGQGGDFGGRWVSMGGNYGEGISVRGVFSGEDFEKGFR